MNAQDLKSSILQRAIEGKLVPQRKEEGTAKDLLVKIRAEKAQLIKEKKIKKTKPLPAITDDEKPFDIPDGWEWVRLDDIVYNHGQKKPNNIFCYIDIGLIDNQKHQLTNDEKVILPESAPSRARKIVKDGDILYATVRPYLHNMCIMNKKFSYEAIASTGFAVMTTYSGVFNKYLFFCLLSPEFDKYANSNKNSKGVAYPAINDTALYKACIPLPPLAEQHRIVAKLEELQPDIDAYDKAQTKLRTIEQRFPEAMKKSLLQYAIEGKLVSQRKEEGTAKDLLAEIRAEKAQLIKEKKIKKTKPLPAITDDEKPFDIPDSWEWARFGDISINMDSERIPLSVTQRRKLDKIYDYYGASGIIDKVDQYLFDRPLMLIGEDGANLLARTKPIAFIARGKYWVNNHAHVIDFPNGIDMKYMTFYMNAINLAAYVTGTAQPKMNQARMNSILIAIPPLAEQHRIVAKLEELLPLCQHLTANP